MLIASAPSRMEILVSNIFVAFSSLRNSDRYEFRQLSVNYRLSSISFRRLTGKILQSFTNSKKKESLTITRRIRLLRD
jgi:hypothetical protein